MNRELTREEEAELSRSTKKVKDVHHAGFNEGLSEDGQGHDLHNAWGTDRKTFKEKLEGAIPGAYAEAFDFSDLLDKEAESDDEVEELREGLAAVKLTRETKLRIRKPWSNALIIKLYGRTVGFNFLQSKLNLLWKPSGRIDCVDLGKEFYTVRFSVKVDMDAVLKNGPWFIGGHFLSIRPWETFFKPDCASVSAIAVWIRLHQLPLELYEPEVLKQIGGSIGKVLRIDTQTAIEARGQYARLCILVDINKPLIDTVLIGRFEQLVSYERLQKLCFSCGRVGHMKEGCHYTIKRTEMLTEGGPMDAEAESGSAQPTNPRGVHVSASTEVGSGTTNGREAGTDDARYGPWTLVTRKKPGQNRTKFAVKSGDVTNSEIHQYPFGFKYGSDRAPLGWAESNSNLETNEPLRMGLETHFVKGRVENYTGNTASLSVKGKKAIARNKGFKMLTKADNVRAGELSLNTNISWSGRSKNGDESHRHDPFLFKADDRAALGLRRLGCGDHGSENHGDQCGDGGQHVEADHTVEAARQWCALKGEFPAPMEDEFTGEHDGNGVQSLKGESAGQQGMFSDLISTTQRPRHGEGSEFGVPGSGEREDQAIAGEDGMELEEGNGAVNCS